MTFTPSATSSFSAGAVFWGMVWSVVVKLDELAKLFGINHSQVSRKTLLWVKNHKTLALTTTELVNYSVHGIESPLSVTFALGGTLMNVIMVLIVIPLLCRVNKPST
jgi:hypothetical protein